MEGSPNELYAQNMKYRHQYDEIMKHFVEGRLKGAGAIILINMPYGWTFGTIGDYRLDGSGRRLENTSEGVRLQITEEVGSAGKLSCYLYIFQDAQINISDAQFLNVVY